MPVYFITAREVCRVKIGYAKNPQARALTAQTGSPVRLALERVCEGGLAEETALHERFAEARMHGEWFVLTAEIEAHMRTLPIHIWRHRGCQHEERRRAKAEAA